MPKKCFVAIQPERAEHPPRLDAGECLQLIENKILERLIFLIHRVSLLPKP
jgi:hypothetical protein